MLPTLHGIDVRKTVMGRLAAGEPPSSTACEERSVPATQAVDSVQLVAEAGVQHHGNSEQDGKETKAKSNDSGNSRGKGKSQPKKIGPRLQTPAKVLKRPAGASQMTPKKKPAAAPAKARPAADVSLEVPVTPEVTPEVHVQAHGSDGAEEDDASTVASDATTMDMGEYYQKQLAKAEARKEAAAMEETKKKPAAQDDAEPCTESTPTKTKAHEDTQSKSPKPKSSKSPKSKSSKARDSKSPKSKSSSGKGQDSQDEQRRRPGGAQSTRTPGKKCGL